nr:hypothetical protein [Candidatus Sigynarchaeota archaeon]
MNLGDAFARRKQIDSEINNWINRLGLAGKDTRTFTTRQIEGEKKFEIIPGSEKTFARSYTIEECRARIHELIEEDKQLARRISITNQNAKGTLVDLDGTKKVLTIPELLVLRNEIAPKLENAARAIPKLPNGIEILEKKGFSITWRDVQPKYKHVQELSDKGIKIEKEIIEYYNVAENTDYGRPEREIFDEIDKIHEWLEGIKNAINEANKTELINL